MKALEAALESLESQRMHMESVEPLPAAHGLSLAGRSSPRHARGGSSPSRARAAAAAAADDSVDDDDGLSGGARGASTNSALTINDVLGGAGAALKSLSHRTITTFVFDCIKNHGSELPPMHPRMRNRAKPVLTLMLAMGTDAEKKELSETSTKTPIEQRAIVRSWERLLMRRLRECYSGAGRTVPAPYYSSKEARATFISTQLSIIAKFTPKVIVDPSEFLRWRATQSHASEGEKKTKKQKKRRRIVASSSGEEEEAIVTAPAAAPSAAAAAGTGGVSSTTFNPLWRAVNGRSTAVARARREGAMGAAVRVNGTGGGRAVSMSDSDG